VNEGGEVTQHNLLTHWLTAGGYNIHFHAHNSLDHEHDRCCWTRLSILIQPQSHRKVQAVTFAFLK
jgi:hypothetical protein